MSKCEPFLFRFARKRYTIMDLGQWFDDIVTSSQTILTVKDLKVTALIIELEHMYLIFFNNHSGIVCGKAYKCFARCHDNPSGLDIVFNIEHYLSPCFIVLYSGSVTKCDLDHPSRLVRWLNRGARGLKEPKSVEKCDKVQRNVAKEPLSRLTPWFLG